ncbi:metal-dependent hydrolase [Blattabacterium cuenoti]|uniref:metal-dependent hydrolase n=1 Tax=Blattabacterium cuenoti TaxID=1653831 RepID=UPI00163B857C|nr:metal-dependent hydrolase [Blattabacterium cuenoti]
MKVIFLTHSTCILEIQGINLLIDPFLSKNPNFKLLFNNYINNKIKNINYILVTHAHYDHTCDVEFFSKKFNALIISNYEISNFFEKKGLKTYGINYGSFINFPFGKLKYIWAIHSSVFNDGTYGGNPGGFLIHSVTGKKIYLSGDTSIHCEMKNISTYGKLNLSILPIGGRYTMDIEEAILASNYLNCNKILGIHYDTFEEIKINHKDAKKRFLENKKKLFLLDMCESIFI